MNTQITAVAEEHSVVSEETAAAMQRLVIETSCLRAVGHQFAASSKEGGLTQWK